MTVGPERLVKDLCVCECLAVTGIKDNELVDKNKVRNMGIMIKDIRIK